MDTRDLAASLKKAQSLVEQAQGDSTKREPTWRSSRPRSTLAEQELDRPRRWCREALPPELLDQRGNR